MTYAIQAFRLHLVHLRAVAALAQIGCDLCGERPNLFGEFGDGQINELQYIHEIKFGTDDEPRPPV